MAISALGWRSTYGALGIGSVALAAVIALIVKEPKRGRFNETKTDDVGKVEEKVEEEEDKRSLVQLLKESPTSRWVLVGAFLRNLGGSCVTYFLPVFFGRNFPGFKAEYSLVNTLILTVLGFSSGIFFGLLGDKFETKSRWTKPLICLLGSGLSLPLIALATLQTTNFWLSMAFYAIMVFISAPFSAQAITMI